MGKANDRTIQQQAKPGHDYDLRVRHTFFAARRNIGGRVVMIEIAGKAELDTQNFTRTLESGEARELGLEVARIGKERYRMYGAPTVTPSDGTELKRSIACPKMRRRRVVEVDHHRRDGGAPATQ